MQRRLTAILSADVVGYSGLMERDESGTLDRLKANRLSVFDPCVTQHGGRIVKLMGDGALVEFSSVVAAVTCAIEIQAAMQQSEPNLPDAERIRYRIGINLGDVIVEGDDIYGDGVNVAARLQALAEPGGVALSRTVRDQVSGKVQSAFADMGEHVVKNIERPVHVFSLAPAAPAGLAAAAARRAPAERQRRVAVCVLPFANMIGDPEQEYFCDGISEDIITDLSKVSALSVVSRNTSFTFKGKHVDVGQVARQLKVTHVLEGSVRKSGNRVRISAQLVEAGSDSHIWAERYDRDLSDIFAMQDEISQAIVAALKLKLLPGEKMAIEQRSTTNAEAYKLFLMARHYRVMGSERHEEITIRLCKRAVELDPNYARAWALMAVAQSAIHFRGGSHEDGGEALERALALDPDLADAHAAKGRLLTGMGRYSEGLAEHEISLRLDPESHEAYISAGRSCVVMHRYDDAIRYFEKAAEVNEADFTSLALVVQCYAAKGEKGKAVDAARRALPRIEKVVAGEPDHGTALGLGATMLAQIGESDRAREWVARALLVDPDNGNARYNAACTLAALGDVEAALDLLEPNLRKAELDAVLWTKQDKDLDSLKDHPRFRKMIADAEARLAAGAAVNGSPAR